MTTERDDPHGQRRSAESGGGPSSPCEESDESLRAWLDETAGLLLRAGYPEAAVQAILEDSWVEYPLWRVEVELESRRAFFGKRITRRLQNYEGTLLPEGPPPRLAEVVRARLGLNALTPHARWTVEVIVCDGRPYEAVAEELGVATRYVEYLVHLSLNTVREWMARYWPES